MTATLFGDVAAMKLLLDRGADPNMTDKAGATALMWAIPELPKVKLLVAHGANVNARSLNLGRTPLLVAAGYPNAADLIRLLLREGADIKAKDKSGMHALGRAVFLADVATVRFLVENGADINQRDGFGEHGLGLWFARQDLKIVEYLLSQGVKLREEALSIAASAQSVTLLDRVLAAGADVNARIVALTSTPLIMATAAEQTRTETLKWLLDKGADPNAKGIDGDRALDWAIYRADQGRIDLLKRYGANPGAATRVTSYPPPEGVADPRAAVERSVSLLLATAPVVFQTRHCITCHNQTLPVQAAMVARQKGIPIDKRLLETNLKQTLEFYRPMAEEGMQGEQPPDNTLQVGYALTALAAQSYPLDPTTASLIHLVTSLQRADGSWLGEGVSRPPD
jgi:ankyrin repeat protein